MSLINENLVEELIVWTRQSADKHIFFDVDQEISSYYIDRTSEETYLQEYAVDTLTDLKRALEVYSGFSTDLPIFKQMLFEISRQRKKQLQRQNNQNNENQSGRNNSDETEVRDGKKGLPEHIYVF